MINLPTWTKIYNRLGSTLKEKSRFLLKDNKLKMENNYQYFIMQSWELKMSLISIPCHWRCLLKKNNKKKSQKLRTSGWKYLLKINKKEFKCFFSLKHNHSWTRYKVWSFNIYKVWISTYIEKKTYNKNNWERVNIFKDTL